MQPRIFASRANGEKATPTAPEKEVVCGWIVTETPFWLPLLVALPATPPAATRSVKMASRRLEGRRAICLQFAAPSPVNVKSVSETQKSIVELSLGKIALPRKCSKPEVLEGDQEGKQITYFERNDNTKKTFECNHYQMIKKNKYSCLGMWIYGSMPNFNPRN